MISLLLGVWASPALAAEPPALPDCLQKVLAKVKRIEAVQMLLVVEKGSQMGPGVGWFHPGQSRYGKDWLLAQFDADKNGKINAEEFLAPKEFFDRLDRNRDRELTADDFDWSERSPLARQSGVNSGWFRRLDANSNGKISAEDWQALFARLAKEKGYLSSEDLRDAFPLEPPKRPPGSRNKMPDEPTTEILLRGLLNGEIGSILEGPRLGQRAPHFTLPTPDGKRLALSELLGQRPVVLVFGSFT